MKYQYFPSCHFTANHNQTAKMIRDYLNQEMSIGMCCLHDHKEYNDDTIGLVVCQNCRQVLESKLEIHSLLEYIDQKNNFVFPDYHGLKVNVQDCWRDRNHPEVHLAMRSLLKKMNIDFVEIANNKEKADYCGTLHYEVTDPVLQEKIKQFHVSKISALPEDLQKEIMQENLKKYQCQYTVVDCNRCLKGIELAGGQGIHILDLLFHQFQG